MLHTVAVRGYRSLRDLVLPLQRLTVVTGANGSGKSSLYRALRLLADCGGGRVIGALAREGGLQSALWAGRGSKNRPVELQLGYAADDFVYLVDLGLPQMATINSAFDRDPEMKREAVFAGPALRPGSTLVRRAGPMAEARALSGRGFDELQCAVAAAFDGASVSVAVHDGLFDVLLSQPGAARPLRAAELSDGTLRFLLWAAALLSPQPPSLMVLNEPETSLHHELIAPLSGLIRTAAQTTQVVVVTHSAALVELLRAGATRIELVKRDGETTVAGQGLLSAPAWHWGSR